MRAAHRSGLSSAHLINIMPFPRLATESVRHTIVHLSGTVRNLLLGGSLYYTVEREEYTHIPVIIVFPSIYSGYHLHKNKDTIVDWILTTKKKLVG